MQIILFDQSSLLDQPKTTFKLEKNQNQNRSKYSISSEDHFAHSHVLVALNSIFGRNIFLVKTIYAKLRFDHVD